MVGTQAPQQLFGDFPANASQMPGMVTPQITAAMPNYADLAGILDAQNKQKAISAAAWARAAAINRAQQRPQDQGVDLPGTASQSSGMGTQYQNPPSGSPSMMWAPRNLHGPQLGTWASQQQNRAIAENREIPMVMQAHTGDPFSPGEVGGGPQSSRGLYGPGLTTAMGTSNPLAWARMWSDRGQGGGDGGDGHSGEIDFPTQSLRERTSLGPEV